MRTVLTWIIYGPGKLFESYAVASFVFNATAMVLCFLALIYVSILWKKYVDGNCGVFTQYLENIVLGKQSFVLPISGVEKVFERRNGTDSLA